MVIQDDTLELLDLDFTTEPYGVGIPEGDTEMKEFVDESVAEFIDDGSWQETYDEWVGQYIPEDQHPGSARHHPRGGAEAVPALAAAPGDRCVGADEQVGRMSGLWEVLTEHFPEFSSGFFVTIQAGRGRVR